MAKRPLPKSRILVLPEKGSIRPELRKRLSQAGYRLTPLRHSRSTGSAKKDPIEALVFDLGILGQEGFILVSRSGSPEPVLSATLASKPKPTTPASNPVILDAALLQRIELSEEGVRMHELERTLLCKALKRADGNQTKAARLLGLTRQTLIYRMRKFGISCDREGDDPYETGG